MAKIMIRAASESDRKSIVEALDDDVHELLGADQAPVPTDDPAEVITDSGADVVITEYIEQDAWSVKVMQDVALRLPFTRFIFLLSQETPLHHLVLAVNEGAAAMLPRPLDSTAIRNYVNRTLNRQKRDREWASEVEQCRQLAEKEKNCSMEQAVEISELKRSLRTGYRLINHLLALNVDRKKTKVLLITDSAYQLDRFRKILVDHNFLVLAAKNGTQGLETARIEHPRIIVSDLEMPGLNGIELCKAVKNDESLAPNYFIICTANEDKMEEVLKPENKVDDCLLKPRKTEDFQEFTARVAVGIIT